MMKTLRFAGALLALACAAQAQTKPNEAAEDKARTVPGAPSLGLKACHADIERFCKKVAPGERRLGTCLQKNKKRLSARCRKWATHGGPALIDEALKELDKGPEAAP